MEFSSELVRTLLVYGGIPALGLGVFYLLLKQYGFSFAQIGPKMAGFLFLAVLAAIVFIIYLAMTRFDAPKQAATYSHSGELQNLISLIGKDQNAPLSIQLSGTDEEKNAISRLHFDDTNATSYSALIGKMCAAKAECIKCEMSDESSTVVTIGKIGEIAPNCKVDGASVYCCA